VLDEDDAVAGVDEAVQDQIRRSTSAMCRPTVGSSRM
jgi:hypothetical protein